MSEFKGTKGKWEVEFDTTSLQKHIKCGNKYIAEVSFGNVENNSNAKLIAHAPEMLEMLKYFTAFPDEDFEEDMDKHISFPMTVDARKIKEAKQLIKEATEL